jgi:hypothetical protein
MFRGPVVCDNSGAPTVVTCRDDNASGQPVSGSTGDPVVNGGNPAISLYYGYYDVTLSNFVFRWSSRAISASHDSPYSRTYRLLNSAINYCTEGIYAANCTFAIQNSTKCGVTTPLINLNASVSGSLAESCPTTLGEAVDKPGWRFDVGGHTDYWHYQTSTFVSGGDAARSGTISHSQSTYMETTVTPAGWMDLSFWWKVSSEAGFDFLEFPARLIGHRQAIRCRPAPTPSNGFTTRTVVLTAGPTPVGWIWSGWCRDASRPPSSPRPQARWWPRAQMSPSAWWPPAAPL